MTHVVLVAGTSEDIDLIERISDRLQKTFGSRNVIIIENTTAFSPEQLAHHTVILLAMAAQPPHEMPWLANVDAPATQVLQAAITQKLPIIPLLLKNAPMVRADALPPAFRSIINYNAIPMRGTGDFPNDIEQLIRAIKYVEHLREDEMVDVVPATPTQAFTQHMRLLQTRRALALLCGALCLGIVLAYTNAGLQEHWTIISSSSPPGFTDASFADLPIAHVIQTTLFVVPTLGLGLGFIWMFPTLKIPFGRSTAIATGLLLIVMILPLGMTFFALTVDLSGYGVTLVDNIHYDFNFSLLSTSVLPKVLVLISGAALVIFVRRMRAHRATTLLAGIAIIILPLLGAYWSWRNSDLDFFGALSITALAALLSANILVLVRAIQLRRWWWAFALVVIPVWSLWVIWSITENGVVYFITLIDSSGMILTQLFLLIWSIVLLVLINTIWPATVLLAPWLMRERVKR